MRPGYQEQILYILNKHHSIVTVELGDAVTDDILQLIDSAKREGARQELEYMMTGEKTVTQYADSNFDNVVTYIFAASEIQDRIAQLEQSED